MADLKSMTASQLEEMRQSKAQELSAIFEKNQATKDDGTKGYDLTVDQLNDVQQRHKELNDIGEQLNAVKALNVINDNVKDIIKQNAEPRRLPFASGNTTPAQAERKSIGQMFIESAAYKNRVPSQNSQVSTFDVELKTLFETGAGWAPETFRTGTLVDYQTRPVQVTDVIPSGRTTQAAIVYMEETTFTNAAAETSEGAVYAAAALALTERTNTVRKIAVYLPVTDEQLDDVAQAETYVNQRLGFMVRQRLDGQILTGDGVAPNLLGLNNVVSIQTQAKGTDPTPDAIYKAMTLVRVTGRSNPNVIIMHPNDWQAIRLLRTVDGVYIWGSPADPGVERIWGLPVVLSDGQTENTALVFDTSYTQLFERKGLEVMIGYNDTDFIYGKRTVRADMRAALVAYRPDAICTVTGI